MRFPHVGKAGLELLTSGGPSTSTSQSAGITGVSHLAQPNNESFIHVCVYVCVCMYVYIYTYIQLYITLYLLLYIYILLLPYI